MRFWDSSALLPLIVRETMSERMAAEYDADPAVVVWCLSGIEIWSGAARRRRDGALESPHMREARLRLRHLSADWSEVDDIRSVRDRALRLLEVHPLRAGDAQQLAAALVLVADRPDGFPFVTLDERLADAAEREGFQIVG